MIDFSLSNTQPQPAPSSFFRSTFLRRLLDTLASFATPTFTALVHSWCRLALFAGGLERIQCIAHSSDVDQAVFILAPAVTPRIYATLPATRRLGSTCTHICPRATTSAHILCASNLHGASCAHSPSSTPPPPFCSSLCRTFPTPQKKPRLSTQLHSPLPPTSPPKTYPPPPSP